MMFFIFKFHNIILNKKIHHKNIKGYSMKQKKDPIINYNNAKAE